MDYEKFKSLFLAYCKIKGISEPTEETLRHYFGLLMVFNEFIGVQLNALTPYKIHLPPTNPEEEEEK